MDRSDRDEHRLVLVHGRDLGAHGHLGGAAHHHPVLGAVVMLLQRQETARCDDDALHLEAFAQVDRFVITPRPVHAAMLGRLGAVCRLQRAHQIFHVLRAGARRHQHGVGGRHHHHVVDADHGGEPPVGVDHAVVGIDRHRLAIGGVAGGVARRDVEDRIPTANVGPAEAAFHHGGAVGLFHHRVVDGDLRRAGEGLRVEAEKAEIVGRAGDRFLDGDRHLGGMARDFAEQHVGAEQEVAGIPQITFGHVARGGRRVRLLDEGGDARDALRAERLATADIAVAGLRLARPDTESDDEAFLRRLAPGPACGVEVLHVEDHMVGGERQHHGVGIALARDRGNGGDRGPGIAAQRLHHHGDVDADLLRLTPREEMEVWPGDDDRRREQGLVRDPLQRLLIGRPVAHQRQELLGQRVARHRPEPCSRAAGQKDWNNA